MPKKRSKKFCPLLRKKLGEEKDADVEYNVLIKLVDDPKSRAIFRNILKDERKHFKKLEKLFYKKCGR